MSTTGGIVPKPLPTPADDLAKVALFLPPHTEDERSQACGEALLRLYKFLPNVGYPPQA